MFPTWLSTDFSETKQDPGDRGVGAALGHQREYVAFPGGERAELVGAAAGAQKLRDDLRVEGGAPGGHPAQRFDELLDIGAPVLEAATSSTPKRGCR